MIIKNIQPFIGQHCETTATGTLLNQLGIFLSEPMLFGLGEGLSYIVWNMKNMDIPFIGGRLKPDILTENLVRNLKLKLEVKETSSVSKAWSQVKEKLDRNIVVGLKLDCYHLEYFTNKFHFAAHYATLYGYDLHWAYLVDTHQQGGKVKTSLESLALARNEKGPMSSRNRMYTITMDEKFCQPDKVVLQAMQRNAAEYLNPPIQNIGYKGIIKTAMEIKNWFRNEKMVPEFSTLALLMEKAGTGGALFRNLYRDFLKESYEMLGVKELEVVYQLFCEIANQWTYVSSLFDEAGKSGNIRLIDQASEVLHNLATLEKDAMAIILKTGD